MRPHWRDVRRALRAALLGAALTSASAQTGDGPARIDWDVHGVPHIVAADDAEGFEAFGWAQMRAHADLLLRFYAAARGTAAERQGEAAFESDLMARRLEFVARGQRWLDAMPAYERRRVESFVAGMNAYAQAHPEAISDSERGILPVRPADPIAHTLRIVHHRFRTIGALYRLKQLQSAAETGPAPAGSNAWAIAPARSASGHAMLLVNPHLPWGEAFLPLFEAQLQLPSMQIYGIAPLGSPYVAIGFNETGGWSHTVNQSDGADVYELRLRDGGYVLDGQLIAFTSRTENVMVKGADGRVEPRQVEFRTSVHGPVVAEFAGKAYALRMSALDDVGAFRQYWDMAAAPDIDGFEAVLSRSQIPFLNVVYANRAGHIFYQYGGAIPDRAVGDYDYWAGVVPGDRSSLIWSKTLPWVALPRFRDPPSGFIQNANDLPWSTTAPAVLTPDSYSPLVAPREEPLGFRPQHSLALIASQDKIGFEDLVRMQGSTRLIAADHMLPALLAASASESDPQVKEALAVLAAWDRHANADSRGAVLFIAWARRMLRSNRKVFAAAWNPAAPLATPAGLADPTWALQVLKEAATDVQKRFGAIDVAYGEVYRLRSGSLDIPASGGPSELGSFRSAESWTEENGTIPILSGDTFVAAVEFGPRLKAQALMTYGNASEPGLPPPDDQLRLFAARRLRDVLYYPEDIARHLAFSETMP